jgi:two-component system sensor kinase FixL
MELASIYSQKNRTPFMIAAALLVTAIAIIDWLTKPYINLGFLYLFPILLVVGFLPRWQTILVAVLCSVLQEVFSNLPASEAVTRLVLASAGFAGTGLFVSEIVRNRQMELQHVEEVEAHVRMRQEMEEQLRALIESSPVAIITADASGGILLANEAAQSLLAPGEVSIVGQPIAEFLPALQMVLQTQRSRQFRTELRCRGRRKGGEAFLAEVWFSTYPTVQGPRLAAIIVDLSEDLRDREDLSLDHMLRNSKILMSAVAHEIRNVSGAILAVHKNLSRLPDMRENEDFRALGTLVEGLENLADMELRPSSQGTLASIELAIVLDELRVLIEPSYRESDIEIVWCLHDHIPLVIGDRYGLQQVFLNLTKNSQRAMHTTDKKQLTIGTQIEPESVVIRFEDTGVGISSPISLFKPFQPTVDGTGLGLYVSRAILRGFGGELLYEPKPVGCCFVVSLARVPTDGSTGE